MHVCACIRPFVGLSVYIYSIVTVVDDVFRPIFSASVCIRPWFPSFVCLSICAYVRQCIRPFVRLSVYIYSIVTVVDDVFRPIFSASVCIRPWFPSFVCLSICAYVRQCIRPFVRLSVYIYSIVTVVDDVFRPIFSASVCIRPWFPSFVCLSICACVHPSVRSSVCVHL